MLFSYQCIDEGGRVKDGRLEAGSTANARHRLERNDWQILLLECLDEEAPPTEESVTTEFVADKYLHPERVLELRPREKADSVSLVGRDDWMEVAKCPAHLVVLFNRQLAAMLTTGVPLVHALDTLSTQLEWRGGGLVSRAGQPGSSILQSVIEVSPHLYPGVCIDGGHR